MKENEKPVVLITGSSGLIGTAVAKALSDKYETVGLDAKFPDEATKIGDFIECDLTSDDSVDIALETVKQRHGKRLASVIHLAAYYDFAGEPSEMYDKLTVQGTFRLLKKLQEFETEQFVFSSTILVMEPAQEDEVITEFSPLEDEPWDYPKSKIKTEKLIRQERGNIKTVILRIAGVYNEDTHTVPIAQQIARIYEKQFESYFYPGDASHGQAFVHLDDLVNLIRRVIEKRGELPETDVFLIAEPDLMSYQELQDEIGKLIHGEEWTTVWIPKFMAKAGAWAQNLVADENEQFIKPWMIDLADDHYPVAVGHARESLGWNPQNRLRDTLPKMIGKLKQNPQKWYEINKLPLPEELKSEEEKTAQASEKTDE